MQQNNNLETNREAFPPAETGNASNPSPKNDAFTPENKNQLLDEKAEKYIREVAPVEDYPDAEEWEEGNNPTDGQNNNTSSGNG